MIYIYLAKVLATLGAVLHNTSILLNVNLNIPLLKTAFLTVHKKGLNNVIYKTWFNSIK